MTFSIRRCLPSDAAAITRMHADDRVYPGLLQLPYASEARWKAMLEGNEASGNTDLVLVAERAGEVISCAGLHSAGKSLRRRHVMTLGIAVLPQAQGQGVGKAMMEALTDYADNWGQVLRIELTVYADNDRAIRLYERCGFEHEGRHRAYALRHGQYVDTLCMARLHPHPPRLPSREGQH
nr:GNAT family N-acetyltransferase [uncultured Roseateles sp.]